MTRSVLLVGFGGFIGTALRFLAGRFFLATTASSFPYGTLFVNIIGSLLLGILFGIIHRGGLQSHEWRLFLTIGICGGFTTFSAFANENFIMLRDGQYFHFIGYTGLSIFLGLLAVCAGYAIIKLI